MRDKVCSDSETFGRLFAEAQQGSRLAENVFYGMTFRRLRSIALTLLRKERAGHTLQPTALVSEMFLKFRARGTRILGEEHFFRVAARAMQQVLIDSARAKFALKRIPPELVAEFLSSAGPSGIDTELCLAVRMVLEKLRRIDPVAAETVWLRFVEGLTIEEVSRSQAREFWRVRADCDFGLRWMAEQLELPPAPRRANPCVAESLSL
ncbi:MAG TPA: ECF-type sigma factor [Bryobacteraceae bacterium]|jgi:RNA polymerase sigma factor (TIGR02999 family)|nr:ECF-type sigma factor [Bryobacteraceae bacterium]